MGKLKPLGFTSTPEFMNQQTKLRYDITQNNAYSRFMEDAPVFVTWYRQSLEETTTDKGLGTVETNIGLSGKKFNKIYHVPLYKVDKSSFNLDSEDIGLSGSYKSSANLVMDTIRPIPEDYFVFEFQDGKYLFKVTNTEIDTIESNNYYSIEFKYDRENLGEIEKQVVCSYSCIFENIGSDEKTIIKNEDLNVLTNLTNIYHDVCNAYYDTFFNQMCSSFTYRDLDTDRYYYDPYVTEYIIRNELFTFKNVLDSYAFDHVIELPKDFLKRYKSSIFYNFWQKKPFSTKIRPIKIQDPLTYFQKSGLPYYYCELFNRTGLREDAELLYTYEQTTFSYDYYGDNILFNTILKYLNIENSEPKIPIIDNDDKKPIVLEAKEEEKEKPADTLIPYIIDNYRDFYCEEDKDYFICTPIVLFIIKSLMNNITINNIKF